MAKENVLQLLLYIKKFEGLKKQKHIQPHH